MLRLSIPFDEKDLAPCYGARWDRGQKTWTLEPPTEPTAIPSHWLEHNTHLRKASLNDMVSYGKAPINGHLRGRVYLVVPYDSRVQAKELGARWDAEFKRWYVNYDYENSNCLEEFEEWLPQMSMAGLLVGNPVKYWCSTRTCWKCSRTVHLACPVLEAPQAAITGYEAGSLGIREVALYYPESLPNELLDEMRSAFPGYQYRYTKMSGAKYWCNTCTNCGAVQGDFQLHEEPGGAFAPHPKEEPSLVAGHLRLSFWVI